MKNKFAIVFIFALFLALPMFGQRGTGQGRPQGNRQQPRQMTEENVKERVNRLADNLKMNEEQKKKILDYELELYKKNQVERQRMMGDREAMRAYMMKQREERDAKYKEVLTKEQWEKFQEDREQRRQDFQNRQRDEGGDGERPTRGRGRG